MTASCVGCSRVFYFIILMIFLVESVCYEEILLDTIDHTDNSAIEVSIFRNHGPRKTSITYFFGNGHHSIGTQINLLDWELANLIANNVSHIVDILKQNFLRTNNEVWISLRPKTIPVFYTILEHIYDSNNIPISLNQCLLHWPLPIKDKMEIKNLKFNFSYFAHRNVGKAILEEVQGIEDYNYLRNGGRKETFLGISIFAALVLKDDILDVGNLNYIRDSLNWNIIVLDNSTWQTSLPNGTDVGGIIGQVNDGAADVSISPAFFDFKYSKDFYIIQPTFEVKSFAYFRQPKANTIRNIFLDTFSTLIWLILGALWILLMVADFIVGKVILRWIDPSQDSERNPIFNSISTICQQGLVWEHVVFSARFMQLQVLFLNLIMFSIYCSYVIAILSVEFVPIQQFSQLSKFNFKVYAQWNFYQGFPFTTTVLNGLSAIDKLKQPNSAFLNPGDWFERDWIVGGNQQEFYCNSISKISSETRSQQLGMFVKKSSILKEALTLLTMEMKEKGFNKRLRSHLKLTETVITCPLKVIREFHSLDMEDLFTPFVLLFFGIILTGIILAAEKLIKSSEISRIES